jgi:hypothetical protein
MVRSVRNAKSFRNCACESGLNVQKSADAVVCRLLQQSAEGPNMKQELNDPAFGNER